MKVNLVTLSSDGESTSVLGTVTWDEKEVKIDTKNERLKKDLEKGYLLGDKTLTPKDGEAFVKGLLDAYAGSRFWAEEVQEGTSNDTDEENDDADDSSISLDDDEESDDEDEEEDD